MRDDQLDVWRAFMQPGESTVFDVIAALLARPDWQDRAACRGLDPAPFFPDDRSRADEAVKVCETCPVRDDCLDAALAFGPTCVGIWGGTTRPERARILRDRQRGTAA